MVDSVVLGATLYDEAGAAILSSNPLFNSRQADQDSLTVDLLFYYDFDGRDLDTTSEKYFLDSL